MTELPLSPEAAAFKKAILAIPRTYDPLPHDLPAGVTEEQMARLHNAALAASGSAVAELKKLIDRHPDFPIPYNYLKNIYQVRGDRRKLDAVLQEMAVRMPDYLFTRLGLCQAALDADGDADAAAAHLGPELSLAALYPERRVFHASELIHYYYFVGLVHSMRGDNDHARAALGAIEIILPDHPDVEILERQIMMANMARMQQSMERDAKIRRSVEVPQPAGTIRCPNRPRFLNASVEALYQYNFDLPAATIRAILSLPRASVIADLITVLDNAIDCGPGALAEADEEDSDMFPIHAIHLLGELNAVEATDAVLRFLAIHPEDLDFWLGDFSYSQAFAGIFGADHAKLGGFLKTPAIGHFAKRTVGSAIVFHASTHPEHRDAAIATLVDALETIATSRPGDNLLDTRAIASLICDLIRLGAVSALPLIRRVFELELVEEGTTGDLASVEADVTKPPRRVKPASLRDRYAGFIRACEGFRNTPVDPPSYAPSNLSSYLPSSPAPAVGRNDPCPCGSGKKYKKCCL